MRNYLLTAFLIASPFTANSALLERLGGLAYYDEDADLTWLADANASGTEMNWDDAIAWAESLDVNDVTGWRLPNAIQPDATCDTQTELSPGLIGSSGFNCTGSEMGNLFYNVLDNSSGSLSNAGPFTDIQSRYWTGTSVPHPYIVMGFDMSNGEQGFYDYFESFPSVKSTENVWAVYDGDVSAVPVPAAVWLFGSGLICMIGLTSRKKA